MRKLTSILALVLSSSSTAHAAGLLAAGDHYVAPRSTSVVAEADEQVLTVTQELVFSLPAAGPTRLLLPLAEGSSVVGVEVLRNGVWEPATVSGTDATKPTDAGVGRVSEGSAVGEWLGEDSFSIDLPDLGTSVGVRVTTLGIAGYDQGKIRLRLPLRAGPATTGKEGPTTASVRILSDRPFEGFQAEGGVESAVVKERAGERYVLRARYDGVFASDFRFSYGVLETPDLWTRLLAHHERCDADGFFLLMMRPPIATDAAEVQPRAFQFVMDRSGSMTGGKLAQAKQSASIGIGLLTPADTLNVIAFDTTVSTAFPGPVAASAQNRALANGFVDRQLVDGGTNISGALVSAVSAKLEQDRARLVVFLTDGQPTAGITDPAGIVKAVKSANKASARIFAFGIGSDVNKPLLKNLAISSGGEAKFLAANADLSTEIGAFLAGIASPVLVDATISFPSGGVFDSYPDTPQDLFAGRQLIVLGRYKQGGAGTAEIRGTSGGASETTAFPVALPTCAEGAAPFLPRLWAKAKIDALLARIAEGGTEDPTTVAQIEELSQQYGIESPYAGFGVSSRPADPSASSSGYGSSSSSSGSSYASGGLDDDEAARTIARTMAFGVATAAAMLAMASRRRRVTTRG